MYFMILDLFSLLSPHANKTTRNEKRDSLLLVTRVRGSTSHGVTSMNLLLLYNISKGNIGRLPHVDLFFMQLKAHL